MQRFQTWLLFFAIRRASVRRWKTSHCRGPFVRSVYRAWLVRDRARGVVHAWSWLVENFSWWAYLWSFRRKIHVVACVRSAFRSAVAIAACVAVRALGLFDLQLLAFSWRIFHSCTERLCWTTWFPRRNRLYHQRGPLENAVSYPFAETKFISDYWHTWA